MPCVGCQSRFSVFTQISPVVYLMFGWKILVTKKPGGGKEERVSERVRSQTHGDAAACTRALWCASWKVRRQQQLHLEQAPLKGRAGW